MSTELSVELLLGREVRDCENEVLGRLTDIRAGDEGGEFVVRCYVVGSAWGTDRVSLPGIVLEVHVHVDGDQVVKIHGVTPRE